MNKQRRKELAKIVTAMENVSTPVDIEELEGIKSDIEMVLMDEEFAFESMPEGLQYSMRGEASQEAQDNMNEAIDAIDEFLSQKDYCIIRPKKRDWYLFLFYIQRIMFPIFFNSSVSPDEESMTDNKKYCFCLEAIFLISAFL